MSPKEASQNDEITNLSVKAKAKYTYEELLDR